MKLRMRHNSVRLRLTRSDVDQLQRAGRIQETVEFPQTPLIFSLEVSQDVNDIRAAFVDGRMTVTIPLEQGRVWATSEEVGMEGEFQGLSLLIEKDWPCLHQTTAENDDTFARP
jgi:hypothetical protein